MVSKHQAGGFWALKNALQNSLIKKSNRALTNLIEHVILLVNLYLEVVKMDNEQSVLNQLFVSKEENICVLNEYDKKRIKELTKDNDTYQMLLDKLEDLSDDDISKSKIKDSLESYIDKVNVIGSYENEKFYKIGFTDAMNLVFECIKRVI